MSTEEQELILSVCNGNMGALRVCSELVSRGRCDIVKKMRDLGIKGPSIWITFKDLGDQTCERMIANVESADIKARLAVLGY